MAGRKTGDQLNADSKRLARRAGQLLAIYVHALRAGTNGRDALRPVAELITENPPEWLSEFLFSWQPTLGISRGVEVIQPSRAELRASLSAVEAAAATLVQELSRAPVRQSLDRASAGPIPTFARLHQALGDLSVRANTASHSSALVDGTGKTRAGRGPAMPEDAISSQVFCALLIAECYRHFNGEYPAPRNRQVALAADLYWRLSGGKQASWGDDPLTAWRRHFRVAISPEIAELPDSSTQLKEIRRHLQLRESIAAAAAARDDQ